MLCQHVVISADPESHGAVSFAVDLGIRYGKKVQVDHIVQGSYRTLCDVGQLFIISDTQIPEGEACKIADDKVSRFCDSDNDFFTADHFNFLFCLP